MAREWNQVRAPGPVRGADLVLTAFRGVVAKWISLMAVDGSINPEAVKENFLNLRWAYENPPVYKADTMNMMGAPAVVFLVMALICIWVVAFIVACLVRCCIGNRRRCNPMVYSKKRKAAQTCVFVLLLVSIALYVVGAGLAIGGGSNGTIGTRMLLEKGVYPLIDSMADPQKKMDKYARQITTQLDDAMEYSANLVDVNDIKSGLYKLLKVYMAPIDSKMYPLLNRLVGGGFDTTMGQYMSMFDVMEDENFFKDLKTVKDNNGNIPDSEYNELAGVQDSIKTLNGPYYRGLPKLVMGYFRDFESKLRTSGEKYSDLIADAFQCYIQTVETERMRGSYLNTNTYNNCVSDVVSNYIDTEKLKDIITGDLNEDRIREILYNLSDIMSYVFNMNLDEDSFDELFGETNNSNSDSSSKNVPKLAKTYQKMVNELKTLANSDDKDSSNNKSNNSSMSEEDLEEIKYGLKVASGTINTVMIIPVVNICITVALVLVLPTIIVLSCRNSPTSGCCCCKKPRTRMMKTDSTCSQKCLKFSSCCFAFPMALSGMTILFTCAILAAFIVLILVFFFSDPQATYHGSNIIPTYVNDALNGALNKEKFYKNNYAEISFASEFEFKGKDGKTLTIALCYHDDESCKEASNKLILDPYVEQFVVKYSSDVLSCSSEYATGKYQNGYAKRQNKYNIYWPATSLLMNTGILDFLDENWESMVSFSDAMKLYFDVSGLSQDNITEYGEFGAYLMSYVGPDSKSNMYAVDLINDIIPDSLKEGVTEASEYGFEEFGEEVSNNILGPFKDNRVYTCNATQHLLGTYLKEQGPDNRNSNYYSMCCGTYKNRLCGNSKSTCQTLSAALKGTDDFNKACESDSKKTLTKLSAEISKTMESICNSGVKSAYCANRTKYNSLIQATEGLLSSTKDAYNNASRTIAHGQSLDNTYKNLIIQVENIDTPYSEEDNYISKLGAASKSVNSGVEIVYEQYPKIVDNVLYYMTLPGNIIKGKTEELYDALQCVWINDIAASIPNALSKYSDFLNLYGLGLTLCTIAGLLGLILTSLGPMKDIGGIDWPGNNINGRNRQPNNHPQAPPGHNNATNAPETQMNTLIPAALNTTNNQTNNTNAGGIVAGTAVYPNRIDDARVVNLSPWISSEQQDNMVPIGIMPISMPQPPVPGPDTLEEDIVYPDLLPEPHAQIYNPYDGYMVAGAPAPHVP